MSNSKVWYKAINWTLLIVLIYFLATFFYKNLIAIQEFDFDFDLRLFLISILAVWSWLSISILGFHLLIHQIAPRLTLYENARIWSTSYLGMYIPGKVGVVAFRITSYRKLGISAAKVGYSFFIEMVLSTISSVFVVLLSSLYIDLPFIKNNLYILPILLIILFVSIHPRLIYLYAKIYYRYVKKSNVTHHPPYNYTFYLKIILLQFIKWIFVGIGVFLLINSVTELSSDYIPFITGLYAFASISGMIAVFAPSGIGVLEGIMILGLKTIFTNSMAGLISILVRIWKVFGELSFVFLLKLLLMLSLKLNNAKS